MAQNRKGIHRPMQHSDLCDIGKWEVIEVWRSIREHIPGLSDTVVYTTRHTCCSWQIIRGIDIRRVQIWTGQKSIQTTLNYAHLAPNHLLDNLTASKVARLRGSW
ncbi:hypothetical protein [Mesorhizobium sp. M0207]|uniref:hypothetical protein n=1 Tax=Mesorhizobium sp. M0207 TaxID=2956915 RepID=UPI00333CB70E